MSRPLSVFGPQQPPAPDPEVSGKPWENSAESPEKPRPKKRSWWVFLLPLWQAMQDDLLFIAGATIYAVVRAMGIKIYSGTTGLRFTFGRASKVLNDGFHPLFPGVQQVRVIPTRSRTLDLPSQRVVNQEGLVYHADANLVYRVVDVHKALIQIDDLVEGMLQMLALGVQEVLRGTDRHSITENERLAEDLAKNLEQRLEPWGVQVERAGFPSISPSPQTLRITQLRQNVEERSRNRELLLEAGSPPRLDLGLVGTRSMPRRRSKLLQEREARARRSRRIQKLLASRGWSAVEIKQAKQSLISRAGTKGRLRTAR